MSKKLIPKGQAGSLLKFIERTSKIIDKFPKIIDKFPKAFETIDKTNRPLKSVENVKKFKEINLIPTDPEWDGFYNLAILSGNRKLQQKLVDAHFDSKAIGNKLDKFNNEPIYYFHSSKDPQDFNIFDLNKTGKIWNRSGRFGAGVWLEPFYPFNWRDKYTRRFRLYSKNPYKALNMLYFTSFEKPYGADALFNAATKKDPTRVVKPEAATGDILMYEPNKIKLADRITYDDAGNIIPLSKRHDFTNPDIRYLWTIPVGLGIGVSQKENKNNKLIPKTK